MPVPAPRDRCPIKVPGRVHRDAGPAEGPWQGNGNGRLHKPDPDGYARPELIGTPGNEYWSGCNLDPVKGAKWSGGAYGSTQEMADEFMRVAGGTCIPNSGGPHRLYSDEYSCEGYDWIARIGVMRPGYSPEDVTVTSDPLITGGNWFIQVTQGPTENYIKSKLAKAS